MLETFYFNWPSTDLQTSSLTASSGTDFIALDMLPMTLQPNETDYVTIKLVNDDVWESNELFTLAISGSSVGGGLNDTVVKIIDDDRKYR